MEDPKKFNRYFKFIHEHPIRAILIIVVLCVAVFLSSYLKEGGKQLANLLVSSSLPSQSKNQSGGIHQATTGNATFQMTTTGNNSPIVLNQKSDKKDIAVSRELNVKLNVGRNILEKIDKRNRNIERLINNQIIPTLNDIVRVLNKDVGSSVVPITVCPEISRKPYSILLDIKILEIDRETFMKIAGLLPPQGLLPTGQHYSQVMNILNAPRGIKILSNPRTITQENEKVEVNVSSNFPELENELVKFTNKTLIKLDITPTVEKDKLITMNIVANIGDFFSGPTKITIKEEEAILMGGLLKDTGTVTKIPILADVPVLGYLFSHESRFHSISDIVIIISPKIVE